MPFDAVGLGLCAWDRILLFDRYPSPDTKVQAVASAASGGGPVPTALAVFSRLGGKAAFIGSVGDDQEGMMIHNDLAAFNVDVTFLSHQVKKRSPCAYIWVDQRNGRRTVALDPGDVEPLSLQNPALDHILRAPLLLMDGRDGSICMTAAWLCHEGGGQVILDAGSPRSRISELLAVSDHAVVSSDFIKGTFPGKKPTQVLREIHALGPSSVVITTGRFGGYWLEDGKSGHYSAYPTSVLDSTGAGDAFHGGYLFGLLKMWDIKDRCQFASAVAALICQGLGGRAKAPTYKEVRNFQKMQA
jgi:ribokinase